MMAEITDATNFDQAVSFMPLVWASGGTIGYVADWDPWIMLNVTIKGLC